MSFGPQEPLDAIVLPESPLRRGWRWAILGVVFLVGMVICAGLVVWVLSRLYGVGSPSSAIVTRWESAAEEQAALRAAFNGLRHPLNDPDRGEIRQLLGRVAATSRKGDDAEFRKLIDFERFVARVASCPSAVGLDWIQQRVLRKSLQDDTSGLGTDGELQLLHLERPADDVAVAYALVVNANGSDETFRLWLCRVRAVWRLFDWERIEAGLSEAAIQARLQTAARQSGYGEYLAGIADFSAADESNRQGNEEAAIARLDAASRRSVPPVIEDYYFYLLALRWNLLGEGDRCLEACRRVQRPDQTPGVYFLQAVWWNQQDRNAQSLQAVENYERVAGFLPSLARIKANLLEAAQRRSEATAYWRRLAEFSPSNTDDMFNYCQSLPEAQRAGILDVVQRAEEPVRIAAALARQWLSQDDEATLILLQRFVSQHASGTPEALDLEASVLAYQGEPQAAAERFRQAAEAENDSEARKGHWYSFLGHMVDAGRTLEGYQAVPDATTALRQLAGGIEDGEALIDFDELRPVLDAHRQRAPDDPWLHYFAGLAALDEDDLTTAEQEFMTVANAEDEELQVFLHHQRRQVLIRRGKLLEAYQAAEDKPEAFRELAANCRSDEDAEGLKTLLDVHRSKQPDDPWLAFYTAVWLQMQRQPEAALATLEQVKPGDERGLSYQRGQLTAQLQIELGRWSAAYQQSKDSQATFESLASQLRSRRDWATLNELCELHRAGHPGDATARSYAVEAAWARKEDARIVQLLTPWPQDFSPSEYRSALLRRQLVTSLLRLGRPDEAVARARMFAQEKGDWRPLFRVLDSLRRWDELEQILADAEVARHFSNDLHYDDPGAFSAFCRESAAASLRERFPPPLPGQIFRGRVTLLLRKPVPLNVERLQIPDFGHGEIQIRRLPASQPDLAGVFEVATPASRAVVAAGSGNGCDEKWVRQLRLRDADVLAALQGHGGWIQIDGVESTAPEGANAIVRLVRHTAAALCDEQTLAVQDWAAWESTSRVVLADGSTADALRRADPSDAAFSAAPALYLVTPQEDDESSDRASDPTHRRRLREFVKSLATQAGEQRHLVKVRLKLGRASEDLWLHAQSADHQGYGNYEFRGSLQADSQLWPHLKQGEHLRVNSSEVLDWRSEAP